MDDRFLPIFLTFSLQGLTALRILWQGPMAGVTIRLGDCAGIYRVTFYGALTATYNRTFILAHKVS
jgi:hypothetical protein